MAKIRRWLLDADCRVSVPLAVADHHRNAKLVLNAVLQLDAVGSEIYRRPHHRRRPRRKPQKVGQSVEQ